MRITLLIIGVVSLLCAGCQTHPPAPLTSAATAQAATFAGIDIFGGYVGQAVANGLSLETQEELMDEMKKMEELRFYQYWKKKRGKF